MDKIVGWLSEYIWQIATVLVLVVLGVIIINLYSSKNDNINAIPMSNRDPITLAYYRWQDKPEALDEIIKLYRKQHPNIQIVVQQISQFDKSERIDPRFDYQEYITKLIADGGGPDMFSLRSDWLPLLSSQISPLPVGFMMDTEEYEKKFSSIAAEDFILNNRIYAIPYSIDNLMLFYNPKILEGAGVYSPPRTWQEVVDVTPKLTQFDNKGILIKSAINLGLDYISITRFADIIATLIMQYGGEMTSSDRSKAIFDQPVPNSNPTLYAAEEALKFYTSFADPRSSNFTYINRRNPDGTRQFPVDVQAFGEGKMAMLIHAGYMKRYLTEFYPNLEFSTASLPQLQLNKPVVIAANYWGETVSKNSQHPNEAWDFINFVANRSNLDKLFVATKHVPSLQDTWIEYSKDPIYGPIAQQASFSKPWYRKHSEEIEKIFARMVNSVLNYDVNPGVVIKSAVRDINNININ